jgi:hypothetical protein
MSYEMKCFLCNYKQNVDEYTFYQYKHKILCEPCFRNLSKKNCIICKTEYSPNISTKLNLHNTCSNRCHNIIYTNPVNNNQQSKTNIDKKSKNKLDLNNRMKNLEDAIKNINIKLDIVSRY